MREHELPTWAEIVSNAAAEIERARDASREARDWLRSDWRPVGSQLCGAEAKRRQEALTQLGEALCDLGLAASALTGLLD